MPTRRSGRSSDVSFGRDDKTLPRAAAGRDADARALAETGQSLARSKERAHVARLVAPVEDRARKADGPEGPHFEVRHHRNRASGLRHDHCERPFHLVEVFTEHAAEIGAGHQHQRVEASAAENLRQGFKHEHN